MDEGLDGRKKKLDVPKSHGKDNETLRKEAADFWEVPGEGEYFTEETKRFDNPPTDKLKEK